MRILILRHGEPDYAKDCLTETGIAQAKLLAERLQIPFYDKELLAEAAKDSGICEEVMENYDEKQERKSFFRNFCRCKR